MLNGKARTNAGTEKIGVTQWPWNGRGTSRHPGSEARGGWRRAAAGPSVVDVEKPNVHGDGGRGGMIGMGVSWSDGRVARPDCGREKVC